MSDKATLLSLAERVEKAEAGSLTLDKEILAALGYTWRGMDYWYRDDSHTWPGMAALTRSLDAAMSLVLEGCGFLLTATHTERWAQVVAQSSLGDGTRLVGPSLGSAKAATPALALCAAALRARAETQP